MKKLLYSVLMLILAGSAYAQNGMSGTTTTNIDPNSAASMDSIDKDNMATPGKVPEPKPADGAITTTTTTTSIGPASGTTMDISTDTSGTGTAGGDVHMLPVEGMTDNQIAGILMTIDDGEITVAKMAARRAKNKEVKEFARNMIEEHKKNMKETRRMLKSYNSGTAKSDLGTTIHKDAKTSSSQLMEAKRDSFDKMYIDMQIAMHEKALSTLNESLLPNATDTNLKTHLEKTKTAVTAHLNEARALQVKLR